MLKGVAAAPGVAVGPAHVIHTASDAPARQSLPASAVAAELALLQPLLARAAAELSALQAGLATDTAEIIGVQLSILDDHEYAAAIAAVVTDECVALPWAIHEATAQFAAAFAAVTDPYIRERAADVSDVGRRLLALLNASLGGGLVPSSPAVIVAYDLTPSQLAALPPELTLAIVCESGSVTSHIAILAKARGIPAVLGVAGAVASLALASLVAVDGGAGTVVVDPSPTDAADWQARATAQAAGRQRLTVAAQRPAVTSDGVPIAVEANIGSPDDADAAVRAGADGVGLFRSEFLFLASPRLPDEDEQYAAYATAVTALAGRPVIIRTLDVGGDKDVPALALPTEANPFLGWRALRISLDRPALLKTQLRAIHRAGVCGPVRIMLPLVSSLDELRQAKAIAAEVRAELAAAGIAHTADVPLGIMVETPAAALLARQFSREVDFFSIGTNDLTQYTLAVDRTNERVAGRYDPYHPAVLRLIGEVAAAARAAGIGCGLCGELGGDPLATLLLIGLGVRELSVSPPLVGRIKERVRQVDAAAATALAEQALACATAAEVRALLTSER